MQVQRQSVKSHLIWDPTQAASPAVYAVSVQQ